MSWLLSALLTIVLICIFVVCGSIDRPREPGPPPRLDEGVLPNSASPPGAQVNIPPKEMNEGVESSKDLESTERDEVEEQHRNRPNEEMAVGETVAITSTS
jgi:hypothetical protein